MKPQKEKLSINWLWKWLENRFREINMKLDHILFRIRKEDPRIYQSCSELEDEEDFKYS